MSYSVAAEVFKVKKPFKHGISIKFINFAIVIGVLLCSLMIDYTGSAVRKKYSNTVVYQQALIACNNAAKVFERDSDELTLYVNTYVDLQTEDALTAYFDIIDNQLREQEIIEVETYDVDCSTLWQALQVSNGLAQREYHAFALVMNANGKLDSAPEAIKAYKLPESELAMTYTEKMELARRIVHGTEYYSYKLKIYDCVSQFEQGVLAATQDKLLNETNSISSLLGWQNAFELIENIMVICLAVLLYRNVTYVLKNYIGSISRNEMMKPDGTTELRYMANVFNSYIEMQSKKQSELRHIAQVDALTQVANRRALEDFMNSKLQQIDVQGAFVMLDVDDFKHINDTYGHDTGDAMLTCLVEEIQKEIRDYYDFIGRFGGDEFVVWFDGMDIRDADLAVERIALINSKQVKIGDLTLPISISAGITFCQYGDQYKDVLRRADTALYEKKRAGKQGCTIYEDLLPST